MWDKDEDFFPFSKGLWITFRSDVRECLGVPSTPSFLFMDQVGTISLEMVEMSVWWELIGFVVCGMNVGRRKSNARRRQRRLGCNGFCRMRQVPQCRLSSPIVTINAAQEQKTKMQRCETKKKIFFSFFEEGSLDRFQRTVLVAFPFPCLVRVFLTRQSARCVWNLVYSHMRVGNSWRVELQPVVLIYFI
jgi:hypothetical protein